MMYVLTGEVASCGLGHGSSVPSGADYLAMDLWPLCV